MALVEQRVELAVPQEVEEVAEDLWTSNAAAQEVHYLEVVVVQADQLGDVNALLRFPAADWSGHLVCRLCIIPLADCASKTCQKLVEIGRAGSSGGQCRRP